MEDRLEFIIPRPGGGCTLGCSGMTGRCWSGSVWVYDNTDDVKEIKFVDLNFPFKGGVPCAVWASEDVLAVAEDGGALEWLSTTEEPNKLSSIKRTTDHSMTIRSLAVNCKKEKLVTVGADKSINVYCCSKKQREMLYKPAHTGEILSVATHPTEPSIFATASLDGNVLIWDIRQSKPATGVYREDGNSATPSCVLWSRAGDGMGDLLIGTVDGSVILQSSSKKDTIVSQKVLQRKIHSLIPSSTDAVSKVAVCGNVDTVKVLEIGNQELKELYADSRHTDVVSHSFWLSESSFLTCGWDSMVYEHSYS